MRYRVIRTSIELARRHLQKMGVSCQKTASASTYPPLSHVLQTVCGSSTNMIFDVGANRGQMARVFRKLFPQAQIISFEPLKLACETLCTHAEKDRRLTVENIAFGEAKSSKFINVNQNDTTSSLLDAEPQAVARLGNKILGRNKLEKVEITTLDDYCEQKQLTKIDLLKLDVQGYETRVLRGATRMLEEHRIRVIMTEVCLSPLYIEQSTFSEIMQPLEENGYKMHSFYGESYCPMKGYNWGDAIFVHYNSSGATSR